MGEIDWAKLDLEEKIDFLRKELDAYLDLDRQNLEARQWRHNQLEKRVAELEKVLKNKGLQPPDDQHS